LADEDFKKLNGMFDCDHPTSQPTNKQIPASTFLKNKINYDIFPPLYGYILFFQGRSNIKHFRRVCVLNG